MLKAFLSHSSEDKTNVRKIKSKVQRFWTYFDEDCFTPGEDFRDAITSRLADTDLFVFFVSRNSLNSSWVRFEIDEAYWQTTQRKNITTLVLTLDTISPSDLPAWMRKAKFEPVRNVNHAAQIIKNILLKNIPYRHVYMGREEDTANFYKEIAQYEGSYPNILAITGLNGIGRKTFIKDILGNRFSLPYTFQFEIGESEGLVELYRKLLDDNISGLTPAQIDINYKEFINGSTQEQAGEIARTLSLYTKFQSCPMLIDSGEMLNNEGCYKDDFLAVLHSFGEKFPDCYLVLIHMRLPKLSFSDKNLIKIYRLNALTPTSCYSLFDALLKQHNVPIPNDIQVKEIADYLEGYPPSIINAVRECVLEGVDIVCYDKRGLMDFQERIFKKYLDSIPFKKRDLETLTAIYNMGSISIEPLSVILGQDKENITKSLRFSHDYNIIELRSDGTYSISPPMRVSIERKLHHYSKEEFSQISKQLMDKFWKPKEDIPFNLIDVLIFAVLRSGQEKELDDFKNHLLPSHLLKAAEKANQDRDWVLAETYARKALALDAKLTSAKIILFKVLVRQETTHNRTETTKEEDSLLDDLRTNYDKSVYYLEGFRLLKRRKYVDAINKFCLAIESGDTSIPTYRDLAECYYQTNQVNEAQKKIETVMKDRKINNPFILDMAAKISISIEDFGRASEFLDKQGLVDRVENVEHRWATYYLKKGEYSTALKHANAACNGERALPEMYLLRMSIAIHQKNYQLVKEDYDLIANKYTHYNHDVREVLYTTMLLQSKGWEAAEAGFCRIRGKNPYTLNLRYKIICNKLKDNNVPFHEMKKLQAEKDQLESKIMFDPLCQFQCYDFQ